MQAISPIYWRRIKAGARAFASIADETVKSDIVALAKAELVSGELSAEQYQSLIGMEYAA